MIAKKTILSNVVDYVRETVRDLLPEGSPDVRRYEGDGFDAVASGVANRDGVTVLVQGARNDFVAVEGASGGALTRIVPVSIMVATAKRDRIDLDATERLDDIEDALLIAFDPVIKNPTDFGVGVLATMPRDSGEIPFPVDAGIVGRFVYIEVERDAS